MKRQKNENGNTGIRKEFFSKMIVDPDLDPRPVPISKTVVRAHEFLDRVKDMLVEKNRAYGDSAANPMRVFSRASAIEQVLVRIDDKLSRVARGAGWTAGDEDVVFDLVGYLAILAALQENF